MADLQVGNVGSTIRATIRDQTGAAVDLSSSSVRTFYFKVGGRLIARAAVLSGTGVDGRIEYVTVAGDLTKQGLMQIQAQVVIGPQTFKTNTVQRPVLENLQP